MIDILFPRLKSSDTPEQHLDQKKTLLLHRYRPYDPSPEVLKRKTDAALALLEKLKETKVDERKLKAREAKALWQVWIEIVIGPSSFVLRSVWRSFISYNMGKDFLNFWAQVLRGPLMIIEDTKRETV